MYARVTIVQILPEKIEESIGLFRDSVVPAAKQQQGFKGTLLLTDPSTGNGMSISLWETEDDMRAGETNGYFQEQAAKFAPLLAGTPTREGYDVSVQV